MCAICECKKIILLNGEDQQEGKICEMEDNTKSVEKK